MSEGSSGGKDSRSGENPGSADAPRPGQEDIYTLYRRGLDLLKRGSAAAAAQLLERAAAAEPNSRSILEALGRAQFDTRRYEAAAGSFRRIVDASPSDDYAQFGLGLALARTGDHGGSGRAPGAGRGDAPGFAALHRRASQRAGDTARPEPC